MALFMYIKTIELTDLVNLRGTHHLNLNRGDDSYEGWTVITGPHGAGKSALLKTIALSFVDAPLGHLLTPSYERWTNHHAAQSTALIALGDEHTHLISYNRWLQGQPQFESKLTDPLHNDLTFKRATRLSTCPLVAFGPGRHLSSDVSLSDEPNRTIAQIRQLFEPSRPLCDMSSWLKDVHLRALEQRPGYDVLKHTAINLLNQGLLEKMKIEEINADGLWVRHDDMRYELAHLSDGPAILGAMTLHILRALFESDSPESFQDHVTPQSCTLPGIVLIDDIEANLHVSWQRRIGAWLKARFPRVQFIVTTHSPFVCQAASPRGIIRINDPQHFPQALELLPDAQIEALTADDAPLTSLLELFEPRTPAAKLPLNDEAISISAPTAELALFEPTPLEDEDASLEIHEAPTLSQPLPQVIDLTAFVEAI